jgi:hypothetical protein
MNVGDLVRLDSVPGAKVGIVGTVMRHEMTNAGEFVIVATPGVSSNNTPEGHWRCYEHELTVLGPAPSTGEIPHDVIPEQAAGIVEMLRDRNDCSGPVVTGDGSGTALLPIPLADQLPPADSTNPKDALGVKKAPLRFVPPALTILASDAMADGAAKYGPFNWRETAVRMTVYLEAIERHLLALRDGQDRAEDSGHLHLSHIAACCGIIADAAGIGMLIDDRPTVGPAADLLRERDRT